LLVTRHIQQYNTPTHRISRIPPSHVYRAIWENTCYPYETVFQELLYIHNILIYTHTQTYNIYIYIYIDVCVLVLSAQRVIWNSKYSIKLGGNQCQNPPRGFIAFSFPYPRPLQLTHPRRVWQMADGRDRANFPLGFVYKLYSGRPLYNIRCEMTPVSRITYYNIIILNAYIYII
jgi:hypothetical protein